MIPEAARGNDRSPAATPALLGAGVAACPGQPARAALSGPVARRVPGSAGPTTEDGHRAVTSIPPAVREPLPMVRLPKHKFLLSGPQEIPIFSTTV
ncbi:hypothetical protein Pen02_17970 [Plantactinospora endophytica]|uniref:Uncharacterized protein n=1 Tax=Plantactinospora endophytica TaxID=673535 RepID=A0ABQ4DWP3_9ACTN|nr:hypothetical protein Pen02_17970 [Plantactinospora endophytica]